MSATNPNTPPTPLYCSLWWWLKRIPLHKKSDHDLGPATMVKDRSFPPGDVLHRGVLSKMLWKQKVKVKIRVIVKHIAAEVSGSHQRSLGLPWQRLNTTPSHCSKIYMWDERTLFLADSWIPKWDPHASHLRWPQGVVRAAPSIL